MNNFYDTRKVVILSCNIEKTTILTIFFGNSRIGLLPILQLANMLGIQGCMRMQW